MQRRAALVHWVGLISILVSLFTPLIAADASAEPVVPEPKVSLMQDAATPSAPVVMEPTVGPTLGPEPTAEPTTAPTPVPTTVAVDGVEEPEIEAPRQASIAASDTDTLRITVTPPPPTYSDSEDRMFFEITVSSDVWEFILLDSFLDGLPSASWRLDGWSYGTCTLNQNLLECAADVRPGEDLSIFVSIDPLSPYCGDFGLQGTVETYSSAEKTYRFSSNATVDCGSGDVSLHMTAPDTIAPGTPLAYDIILSNPLLHPISGGVLLINLPQIEGANWTLSGASYCSGGGSRAEFACIQIGVGAESSHTVTVSSPVPTSLACGSSLTASASVDFGGSDEATTEVVCEPKADISIDGPATIAPGDALKYTVSVSNPSSSARVDGTFTITLPEDVARWHASVPSGSPIPCADTVIYGGTTTCSGSLPPDQTVEISFSASTSSDPSMCETVYTAQATLSTGGSESATASTRFACTADVDIGISGPTSASPGHLLEYTITVANNGTAPLMDGSFSSYLPVSFGGQWTLTSNGVGVCESVGTTSKSGTCSGITLAPDTSATFTLQAQTTRELACEPFVPFVELNGQYADDADFSTVITCASNLSIEVLAANELSPGDPISFDFRLRNHGTGDSADGAFTAELPDTDNPWSLAEDAPESCSIDGLLLTCTDIYVQRNDGTASITVSSTIGTDRKVCTNLIADATLTAPHFGTAFNFSEVACTSEIDLTMTPIQVNGVDVSGEVTNLELGDVVTYQLVATNTGNSSLDNVVFTFNATDAVTCPSPAPGTLGPEATLTCEASHTMTQADIDRGSVVHQSSVSGAGTWDRQYSDTASATVTTLQQPATTLDIIDTYHGPTETAPQGTIAYTFLATNTGNITLTTVQIFETSGLNMLGLTMTCSVGEETVVQPVTLALGQTLECQAIHEVTQTQLDAGKVDASYNTNSGQTDVTRTERTTPLSRNPGIVIESVAQKGPDAGFGQDDVATFDITVTNMGNVTLTGVTVTDDNPAVEVACPVVVLAPGGEADCTATATIDQDDVDAGSFTSTPRVTATSPQGTDPATVSARDSVTVDTNSTPDIGLWMSASPMPDALVQGTEITYVLRAANTGTVTLADVEIVSDSLADISDLACMVSEDDVDQPVRLGPGAEVICEATYSVTADDVDRGSLPNTASVTGRYGEEEVSDSASLTIGDPSTRRAEVEIAASASPQFGLAPGDDVGYTFTVRNTGTVTLKNLVVTADGINGLDCGDGTNAIGSLAPGGASLDCTATFAVTQEFLDTSEPYLGLPIWGIDTVASVTADAPAGMDPAQVSADATVQIGGGRTAIIYLNTLVTHVDGEDVAAGEPVTGLVVGQEITYSLTASNGGYMTLRDVQITDPLLGDLTCPNDGPVTLLYDETISCEGTLTITQEMFDTDQDRKIESQGEATAIDPAGDDVINWAHYHVMLAPAAPGLTLETSVSPESVDAPQDVTYTLTVTNSGNISLDDITVEEHELLDASSIDCDADTDGAQGFPTLAIGTSSSCTLSFNVTQEHIDAGDDIVMTLFASGETTAFGSVTSNDASATLTIEQDPAVGITKTVVGATDGLAIGDTVEYTIAITNEGNVTLPGVSVSDEGATSHDCTGLGAIFVGETIECSARYVITETDIVAGEVINTATVTAIAPSGVELSAEASATVTTEAPVSSISLEMTTRDAAGETIESASLGDEIAFSFEIRNTGNITVTGITIQNEMLADAGIEIPAVDGLAPGEFVTVTANYTVTAADVEAGTIVSDATATGTDALGESVTSPVSSVSVAVVQSPALDVTTEVSTPGDGVREGSVIDFVFTVTNTGDVTIRDVELSNNLPGLIWTGDNAELASMVFMAQVSTGGAIGDMVPGESVTIRAAYTVTTEDVAAGMVRSTSVAMGVGPDEEFVSSDDDAVVIDVLQPAPGPTPITTPEPGETPAPEATAPQAPDMQPGATAEPITKLPSTGSGQGTGPTAGLWIIIPAMAIILTAACGVRIRLRRG